jgi:prepilin-type N-terminal cleavage/methylation domain-containing protein
MRRKEAFTLIELLMVVSIIALLMGIILPSLNNAKDLARRSYCANNLHGAGVALRVYLNDNRDVMPVVSLMPSLKLDSNPRLVDLLAPYLGQKELLKCPKDVVGNGYITGTGDDRNPEDQSKTYFDSEGSSYQYNTRLGGRQAGKDRFSREYGENQSPVLFDYKTFHGQPNTKGAMNYLMVDSHVGDLGT